MLLNFAVENYRSIRDRQELSFRATSLNERSGVPVELRSGDPVTVLPAIGLYGPNASGKSNVLRALVDLVDRTTWLPRDVRASRPDPFKLDGRFDRKPTVFEIEFALKGVRYEYHLAQGPTDVVWEWLHAFPRGRRQAWFERSGDIFTFPGGHLRGAGQLTELVRPDGAFLPVGLSLRHPQLSPVARWMAGVVPMTRNLARRRRWVRSLGEVFESEFAELAGELVRRADLGITGAELVHDGRGDEDRRELRFRHDGADGGGLLPLSAESDGTLAWIAILDELLPVLAAGGVAVADELDASLHPELSAEVVRMFQDPEVNLRRAQLLFACHDVTMLGTQFGNPLLDRDQVWFTEKNEHGATDLFPLSDLSPRKGENIERGYLAGRYGAIPGLSPGELGRALRHAWGEADQVG